MITFAAVLARVPGLDGDRLRYWIAQEWVRPEQRSGEFLFGEIDLARLRLIADLEQTMEVSEETMPVVLSLLDQLHESRRRLRRLCEALAAAGGESADEVVRRLLGA